MSGRQRVFLLDYDLVSPLGIGRSEVFASLAANSLPAARVRSFCAEGLPVNYAAEIHEPLGHWYADQPEAVRSAAAYDRKFELAVVAFSLMEDRLRRITSRAGTGRAGIVMGVGVDVPPLDLLEQRVDVGRFDGSDDAFAAGIAVVNTAPSRLSGVLNPHDVSAVFIAECLDLGAFQKTVLTACTASTQAIALAFDALARADADVVVAGGTDSIVNLLALLSFSRLGVLAAAPDPTLACRPFDLTRHGTLAGEAAGLCLLAGESFVRAHRLEPMAELLGYGNTLDGYNITAPDPAGAGMKRAFSAALRSAGVKPDAIDYVNLHGTGTRSNDPVELDAVIASFGEAASAIAMSSTKDRHGHAIAAAGIQELAVTCLCMEEDFIPCNANLQAPLREASEVDLVAGGNRNRIVRTAVTTNFAFGGINTALVLRRS
jgi:3-oxoacyl-[acyl-carrier-protein] synthase II